MDEFQGLQLRGELIDLGFGKTKQDKPFVILRVLERGKGATLRAVYDYGGVADKWKGLIGAEITIPVWIDCYVLNGQARMKFMVSGQRMNGNVVNRSSNGDGVADRV